MPTAAQHEVCRGEVHRGTRREVAPVRITATLTRHLAGAAIEALVVALLIAIALLALSPVSPKAGELAGLSDAQARGKSSITVPDGVFGQAVMATVNPGGSGVWAYAACFQDGQTVWAQYVRPDAENHAVFGLGASAGLAATLTALPRREASDGAASGALWPRPPSAPLIHPEGVPHVAAGR
jgi:hypothetical protein